MPTPSTQSKSKTATSSCPPYTLPSATATPRALGTPLIDQLRDNPDQIDPRATSTELITSVLQGHGHEHLPFTGQTAGLIHEITPAAVLVEQLVTNAQRALDNANTALAPPLIG